MKPFKGTFAERMFHMAPWHSVKFLSLALVLWALPLFGAQVHQSPLYISYEKRILLTYLLAGAGESEEVQLQLANRMDRTIAKMIQAPVQEVQVKNFAEFIQIYKGPWPNSYSVNSDLHLLESQPIRGLVNYKAVDSSGRGNLDLQKQIQGFILNQNQRLIEKTGIQAAPMAQLIPMAEAIFSADQISLKRKIILQGFRKVTDLCNQQFAQLEKVGDQIAASGKLAKLNPSLRLFLETVLQKYFTKLGLQSKKQIVSRFLGENLTSDPANRFELMLMSAGPQLQKLLQVISGNSDVSEDLQKILKKLESKIFPIPAPIVYSLFESERDRYRWINYSLDPLGTGTMAQVHRGIMKTPNGEQDVVIRFLKPEIALRVAEDGRILGEIAKEMDMDQRFRDAGLPKLTPIVQDTNRNVTDELDLQATIERQKIGLEVYKRTFLLKTGNYKNYLKVSVPQVYEGGVGSHLMVQALVEGKKFETEMLTYKELIPKLGRAIGEEMATIWAEEAFFKSGFFHSDLHQGNYLVFVKDEAIYISVLDFGMGGVLSKDKQQSLVLAGIGLKLERPELIAKALWGISLHQINQTTEADLNKKIESKLKRIKLGIEMPMELSDLMAWSMDEGVRFTYEIVSMNRGMMIIDQALKEVGSPHSLTDFAEMMVPRLGGAMIKNLHQQGILTTRDFIKLGWAAMTNTSSKSNSQRSDDARATGRRILQCQKVYSR